MENPLKPSPVVGEVLPGFTAIVILSVAYFHSHIVEWSLFVSNPTTGVVLGGVFVLLLASWVVGTVADSIRDLLEEWILDKLWPVNWSFLFHASSESIGKLNDSWLAYYFLSGNFAITLFAIAIAGQMFNPIHISAGWAIAIVSTSVVLALNAYVTRKEVRALIGYPKIVNPHEQVYTRLGVSKIRQSKKYGDLSPGIGVFAIRDIPKSTLIFSPDDDETVIALNSNVTGLPDNIKKLYEDFCVRDDDKFTCPVSFNKLTPAWYVNDSTEDNEPNVKPDESLRFFALRDIQDGEELLARYEDYSD
jgi:hypothetical protein